jgi:hypothetical protein
MQSGNAIEFRVDAAWQLNSMLNGSGIGSLAVGAFKSP